MSCIIADRTAHAPAGYRVRERAPREVDLVVLHQTGTGPLSEEAADRVKAHVLVRADGRVLLLHPLRARMRYGSGPWNARAVNVELEGLFPGRLDGRGRPVWWTGGPSARDRLADRPEQVAAALAALAWVRAELPSVRLLGGHRQVQGATRGGCPGPDPWRLVAAPALAGLGFSLVETAPTGKDIPENWWPPGAPGGAVGGRPVAPPCPLAVPSEPSPLAA